MFFSTLSVPIDPQGTCTGTIGQDYAQAKLPGDPRLQRLHPLHAVDAGAPYSQGLCFIDRQYPAPAGGSYRNPSSIGV
jgi:hypothetical protein